MSTISTRAPTNSKLQLGGASRLRSSSSRKPPEPLRRAVADSLSSSALSQLGGAGAGVGAGVSEPSRTLRDYLAAQATIDLAYCVILEHTLSEKERSPAVVARCVALLKRYLLRYKPSEETLQQIDRFCVNIIAECDVSPSQRSSPWLQPSNHRSGASTTTTATTTTTNMSPPLPVSSFASGALVKSLNYVRSLVAQHMPKRSFQPAAFAGAHPASRKSLPSLSSLLSRSFNSQLKPANNKEPSQYREASALAVPNSSIAEEVDGMDELEFIALDVLNWRWCRDQQSSLLSTESHSVPNLQDTSTYNFLEVGAAALLVGDVEANMKGQPWRNFGTADMPYLDQLLQPSLLTTVTNSASARAHLRAITATKRTKPSSNQIWKDSSLSTFRPRARPLFQYRHYSEQQPLRLSPAEVCEVIAAVCSETPPNATLMTVSSKLSNNSGKPSMDVAVSVLIKLVIDMYVLDSGTAAPLTLSMLKEMLSSPRLASRCRAFDLILNLGVHGHLLEPMILEDTSSIEEDYSQDSYIDNEAQIATQGKRESNYSKVENSSAVNNFESWILGILYEILLHLVQIQEREESVWASALSCLLYFVCHRGKIRRNRLEGLDIRVVKVVIEISRRYTWAEVVRSKLICMFTNMFYQVSDINVSSTPKFLVEQIDLIGGIDFIFLELLLSNSREERRNLYLVLFDYVLHLINEICIATGVSEFRGDEIQPIATLLMLADAPEAFYISIKLGVEGIGELLRKSVSAALSAYPNSDRLNKLLEKITEKIDTFIRSFIHLDREFTQVIQITKSYKSMKSIEGGVLGHAVGTKVKLSWASLHSLLHSERLVCRHNGYVWLGDLLIAEISEKKDANIWSNIRNLQQKIELAGVNDYSVDSDVPLPVWLLCGLLKSKNVIIRWGFLFVLERLLMRCKFLLDENELQHSSSSEAAGDLQDNCRLDKANAVIDIMSSALALVEQETDRVNILKMCDILFSQLCLNVLPATTSFKDTLHDSKVFGRMCGNKRTDAEELHPQPENFSWEESMDDTKSRYSHDDDTPICETASMAALLLRGQAIVPMQLVARVPVTLFHWPLIQLAGEATDNVALGVSVGSKGRGYLPGATSDIRATLLLLLIGKCTADPVAFQYIGGEEFFRMLLDDPDSRVAYYSSTFLLKRMMTEEPEKYQRMLQSLIFRAQQSNNEKLLENPYLQMRGILHLSNQ